MKVASLSEESDVPADLPPDCESPHADDAESAASKSLSLSADSCPPTSPTPAPEPQPTRFLARQPILDTHRNIIGYELLFRTGWENSFRQPAGDVTTIMFDNIIMGIGALAHHELAFVNCTRDALINRHVTLLPPTTTVLEILETVEPDADLVEACRVLAGMGYRIALDDFIPRPEMQPLVNLASYIKVDFRLSDAAQRRQIHQMLRTSNARLLAEKVETEEEFHEAIAEGYEFFQGHFFCRPNVLASHEIPPSRQVYLRLLVELTRSPLDISLVTSIVESETSLTYRLLRLANSAMACLRTPVTSVRRALTVVGEDRFRMLVSIAAACALGQEQPQALISLSLERARFCELLAPLIHENPTEQYMLGLLSVVDAILQTPMESIVAALPLRAEATEALLSAPAAAAGETAARTKARPAHTGDANPVSLPLNLIKSFEQGDWGPGMAAARDLGLTEDALATLYMDALKWAADALAIV